MAMTMMFQGFQIIFWIIFLLIAGAFILTLGKNIGQWHKNNESPRLIVEATVVSRRTNITHHTDANHMSHSKTIYYVTFEVESGDRIELKMTGSDYGMLAEGDYGRLTFQGKRYLGFERM